MPYSLRDRQVFAAQSTTLALTRSVPAAGHIFATASRAADSGGGRIDFGCPPSSEIIHR